MDDTTKDSLPRNRWWVGVLVGITLLALGAALGALPHAIAQARTGSPAYVADRDELLYLAWSRDITTHGAGHLTDAIGPRSGPVMHPWPLFVPQTWLGHALGFGPLTIGILWRALAGATIAAGLYPALRPLFERRAQAWFWALILIAAPGLAYGQPLGRDVRIWTDVLRDAGRTFADVPDVFPHLRIVTPGLALAVFLAYLGLLADVRRRSTLPAESESDRQYRLYIGLAGGMLGLLIHLYFYFWTTAILGTAMAVALDRRRARSYLAILTIGLAVGAPALIHGAKIKASTSSDWLLRTDKFVPIGRFEEWQRPPYLMLLGLAVTAYWAFGRGRPERRPVWCVAAAGVLLLNHQLITKLQIENFHYIVAAGVPLTLLLVSMVPSPTGRWRWAAWFVLAWYLAVGFGLRTLETVRTAKTRQWNADLAAYLRDRSTFRLPIGAITAGDDAFTSLDAAFGVSYPLAGRLVDFSSRVTEPERDQRLALNAYLVGLDRAEAERRAGQADGFLIWEAYHMRPEAAAVRGPARVRAIAKAWDDPAGAIRDLGVTYVVVRRGRADPRRLARLGRMIALGATWEAWRLGTPALPESVPAPGP